jgi:hypothetical protein
MATPHADFQDFRCSDGSGNPKTVKRFGYVGLMSCRVRQVRMHLTVAASGALPTSPAHPPC